MSRPETLLVRLPLIFSLASSTALLGYLALARAAEARGCWQAARNFKKPQPP
jgi:hypothetical protein